MKQFDVVRLIKDLPAKNLRRGLIGVVIDVLANPTLAYEVEFTNESGETLAEIAVEPEYLELVVQA